MVHPLTATALLLLHATLYVTVLYLSPLTRPSTTLPRDSPTVIHYRTRAVLVATLLSITITRFFVPLNSVFFPDIPSTLACLGLTAVLFAGPLYERFLDGTLADVPRGTIGWRNLVIAPVTEEVVFRGCMIPLQVAAGKGWGSVVLLTPLVFGIAHAHHAYEFLLQNPGRYGAAAVRTVVQATYTTVFGWFAAFITVRTGGVLAAVVVHSFCNWMGVPGVDIGREYGLPRRALYWALLVGGCVGFYKGLWWATESKRELMRWE